MDRTTRVEAKKLGSKPTDGTAPEPAHDPYAVLRIADYRLLLAANVLMAFTAEMQSVALRWELYERTDQAEALGLVGLVQFLPFLLLALPAGHAADRYRRKYLVAGAQALMAAASAGLAVLSVVQGPIPLMYLCLFLVGVCRAFSAPARWSLVPEVVPTGLLGNAMTWNSSGWQVASICGPVLGGFLSAYFGRADVVYLLSGVSALGGALLVLAIRSAAAPSPGRGVSLRSLLAGVGFVWRSKLILATITLDLFAVLLGGATALLPVFARDILHVGSTGFGWLQAAPALGAVAMAMLLAHRPPFRRAGLAMLWSVAGFGAATIVFGLSENFLLSFFMLALTGAFDNVSVVVRGTLVQVLTPDDMRGRVTAVNTVFIASSNHLGEFESGMTAEWFGAVPSVVGGGVGTILVVGAVMVLWPQVLRLGALHRAAEGDGRTDAGPSTEPLAGSEAVPP